MEEQIISQAFTLSDSVFLVLLVAVSIGFWRLQIYIFKKNDEREKRYIDVIEMQAKGLQAYDDMQDDVKAIKHYIYRKDEGPKR